MSKIKASQILVEGGKVRTSKIQATDTEALKQINKTLQEQAKIINRKGGLSFREITQEEADKRRCKAYKYIV